MIVIWWYKQSNVNDQSNNDDLDDRVESGEIGYHIVPICPINDPVILNSFKFMSAV